MYLQRECARDRRPNCVRSPSGTGALLQRRRAARDAGARERAGSPPTPSRGPTSWREYAPDGRAPLQHIVQNNNENNHENLLIEFIESQWEFAIIRLLSTI